MDKKQSIDLANPVESKNISLRRPAGLISLIGLAISAVIVGEFSGWNQGLLEGGFGGMLVASLLVILMYGCLCISMAELTAMMPFTGGAYGFARAAMGPWGGLIAGISQIIEYQLALSTIVVAIGFGLTAVLKEIIGISVPGPFLWVIVISIFLALNSWDTKLFFRSAVILAVAPVLVLAIFWYLAFSQFDISHLIFAVNNLNGSSFLPNGLIGIAWALPFAIWFFLSIEVVTLAGEETRDPQKNIPRSFLLSFLILTLAALATLFLNSGISPGAEKIGASEAPLLLGFQSLIGAHLAPTVLTSMILIGSIASFHSTIYAAGRSIYSLARAGYFPAVMAKKSEIHNTPYMALVTVAILTFVLALATLLFSNEASAISILLNMSVLGAVLSYVLTLISFVVMRYRYPKISRPYISPLGVTGAITGLIIAVFTFFLMFTNSGYRVGLVGCIAIYGLGALIYICGKQARNPDAPEEAFANFLEMDDVFKKHDPINRLEKDCE